MPILCKVCLRAPEVFKRWLENWQKFNRQKFLPFVSDHGNPYQRNAQSLLGNDVEEYDLENQGYEPGKLYHVTTNLRAIKADQQLKSRNQLKNKNHIGLGGGPSNMAPHLVSLTYNYSRALEIYHSLQFVADIVGNSVSAYDVYLHMDKFNDNVWDDELTHFDEEMIAFGVPEEAIMNGDQEQIKTALNEKNTTPQQKYEFLQSLEGAILEDGKDDENRLHDNFIGFTADFTEIQHLQKRNIAIIQVVVRKHGNWNHYVQEAEIRVDPKDVAIVRYIQPN